MKKKEPKKKLPSEISEKRLDDIESTPLFTPIKEKDADSFYSYVKKGDRFQVFNNGKPVFTPGGLDVTSTSELLAQAVVKEMNDIGEQYEAVTITSFLYSEIEFFRGLTREKIENDILNNLQNIDWTLDCPYDGVKDLAIWTKYFGISDTRKEEIKAWLKSLNKHQIEGVYVLTGNMSSPNIAFILSNKIGMDDLPNFTRYCVEEYSLHQKKEDNNFYYSWPYELMLKIFENYLFWKNIKD